MNKRGQIGIGVVMLMFIGVIVGVILFQTIAQQVGQSTQTDSITNYNISVTTAGTTVTITDYKHIGGTVSVTNASGATLNSGNYTISNSQVVDGDLSAVVNIDADVTGANINQAWTINSTLAKRPDYIESSAARSIAGLIAIFFALAVVVVALVPSLKSGILEAMDKIR